MFQGNKQPTNQFVLRVDNQSISYWNEKKDIKVLLSGQNVTKESQEPLWDLCREQEVTTPATSTSTSIPLGLCLGLVPSEDTSGSTDDDGDRPVVV